MPSVPRYRRQVQEQAGQAQRNFLRPDSTVFGGYQAKVMQQVGSGVERLGEFLAQRQEENDRTLVRLKANELRSRHQRYVIEAKSKRGKDAFGITDKAEEDLKNGYEETLKTLENENQKELFRLHYEPVMGDYLNNIYSHQLGQEKELNVQTRLAQRDNAVNDAAILKDNKEALVANFKEGERATREAFKDLGKEAVKEEVLKYTTRFHASLIQSYLNDKQIEKAKDHFRLHKDDINSDVKSRISKILENESNIEASQKWALALETNFKTREERLEAIDKSDFSPELKDDTRQRINRRHQEDRQISAEKREATVDAVRVQIENSKSYNEAMDYVNRLKGYDYIGVGEDRGMLAAYVRRLYGVSDSKQRTDFTRYQEARERIDKGEIKNIGQLQLEYRRYATDGDFKQLVNYFQDGGNANTLKETDVKRAYLYATNKDEISDHEKYYGIYNFVSSNLPPGKKPIYEEVKKLVTTALIEGESKGGGFGWGEDLTYYEAIKEGKDRTWLPGYNEISKNDLQKIKQILTSRGLKLTPFNQRLIYRIDILGQEYTKELQLAFIEQNADVIKKLIENKTND